MRSQELSSDFYFGKTEVLAGNFPKHRKTIQKTEGSHKQCCSQNFSKSSQRNNSFFNILIEISNLATNSSLYNPHHTVTQTYVMTFSVLINIGLSISQDGLDYFTVTNNPQIPMA